MPKRKNLDLAAEMGEEVDVTEEQANEANQIVAAPAAPLAPITLTFEQLQTLLSTQGRDTMDHAAIASAITQGIQKTARHQNEVSPEISDFNPAGDRDHPRPGLKCKMSYGTRHPKTQQARITYPFMDGDLTAAEQIALNTLEPWEGIIHLLDGSERKLSLVPTYNDVSGVLERLIIVVPEAVTAKGSEIRNMLPGALNLVNQITGRDFSKLSLDDLKWFLKEHRNKNYVAVREVVAA